MVVFVNASILRAEAMCKAVWGCFLSVQAVAARKWRQIYGVSVTREQIVTSSVKGEGRYASWQWNMSVCYIKSFTFISFSLGLAVEWKKTVREHKKLSRSVGKRKWKQDWSAPFWREGGIRAKQGSRLCAGVAVVCGVGGEGTGIGEKGQELLETSSDSSQPPCPFSCVPSPPPPNPTLYPRTHSSPATAAAYRCAEGKEGAKASKKSSRECWISWMSCNGVWKKMNRERFSRKSLASVTLYKEHSSPKTAVEQAKAGKGTHVLPCSLFWQAKGLPGLCSWAFVLQPTLEGNSLFVFPWLACFE